MKYIKTFESLSKKMVDPNKIYAFNIHVDKGVCNVIGNIVIRGNMSVITGYVGTRPVVRGISRYDWTKVREATESEIEDYNTLKDLGKYNL